MWKKLPTKIIIKLAFVAIVITALYALHNIDFSSVSISEGAKSWGYFGVFVAAIVSGFNIFVPIPIATLVPTFVEIGLDPIISIIVISIGMTTGDAVGFFIGKTGREVVNFKSNKWYKKLEYLHTHYPRIPLIVLFFYASAAPVPNELIVIPMAFLGYRFHHMMIAVVIGNAVFNTLIAYGTVLIFT